DRPEDDLDRTPDAEHLLGKQVVVVERKEYASRRRQPGRDQHREHLVAECCDADRARRLFVLANGAPEISKPAVQQSAAEQEGQHGHRQYQIIEHRRISAQLPDIVARVLGNRQEQSARRPNPAEVIKADARELREGDRQNRKISPGDAKLERQKPDQRAARHRQRNRNQKSDPGRDTIMNEQRGSRVSAKPDIERVTERELAGKAHHHVPGLARIGVIQNDDENTQEIVADECRRGDEEDQQSREQHQAPALPTLDERLHAARLPRMPCGRSTRTSTRIANANMLLAEGVNSSPANASVNPIRTPPSNAPGNEPSPPVITMTKASSV